MFDRLPFQLKERVSSMVLLIVEDERMTREGLLKSVDWPNSGISNVFSAENGEAGLFMAKRIMPDIVLTDIKMNEMDGLTLISEASRRFPNIKFIILTGYDDTEYLKKSIG